MQKEQGKVRWGEGDSEVVPIELEWLAQCSAAVMVSEGFRDRIDFGLRGTWSGRLMLICKGI